MISYLRNKKFNSGYNANRRIDSSAFQEPGPDEQFTSNALLCSIFSVVEKASFVICDGQFSLSHRTSQVEPSPLLQDKFSKISTLPWQNRQHTASWSFS